MLLDAFAFLHLDGIGVGFFFFCFINHVAVQATSDAPRFKMSTPGKIFRVFLLSIRVNYNVLVEPFTMQKNKTNNAQIISRCTSTHLQYLIILCTHVIT